jgi:hypothetical protein
MARFRSNRPKDSRRDSERDSVNECRLVDYFGLDELIVFLLAQA